MKSKHKQRDSLLLGKKKRKTKRKKHPTLSRFNTELYIKYTFSLGLVTLEKINISERKMSNIMHFLVE